MVAVIDTIFGVFFFTLIIITSAVLLLLAAWIFVVILVTKAYKKNNFVYYVLSLAIADFVLCVGQLIDIPQFILSPNTSGGLSSPLFSVFNLNIAESIVFSGATQHYLVMAFIAAERLYSVVRPFEYEQRGPPIPIVVGLAIFFAFNLAATTGVKMATSPYTYNKRSYAGWYINDYAAIALVLFAVLIYAALVITVHWKAKKNVVGGTSTEAKRRMKVTKAVLQVGVVFFATAFVFTVIYTILAEFLTNGLIPTGPYYAASAFVSLPIAVGEVIDLSIFAMKIEEIKAPSVKYLKKIRVTCCGLPKPPPAPRQGGSTKKIKSMARKRSTAPISAGAALNVPEAIPES